MTSCVLHVLPKIPPNQALLGLLLVLLLALHVLAVCPPACSCEHSHRDVDCSWRGLRHLPEGLQHNIRSLNLSHNRFQNLDGQLSAYSHLRVLDLSHNRLGHLPAGLPRSLWQLRVASNRLQVLDKNDTVYQWNLRTLDLSNNRLQRATFINNTLINLCTLNLSYNNFWTLPTNMPAHLEAVDLSHNLLTKVLPESLDRLPRLTYLYLHANRLSSLPFGVLDKLSSLRFVALGDNPWACDLYANISYLVSWTQQTSARVLGCPCHTQPVCGGARPGRTGGWHFASYNLPPLAASAQDLSSKPPQTGATGWWFSISALQSTPHTAGEALSTAGSTGTQPASSGHVNHPGSSLTDSLQAVVTSSFSDTSFIFESTVRADVTLTTDQFFTTESPSAQTKKTTTLRTRSVRRKNPLHPGGVGNSCPAVAPCCLLGLLSLLLQHIL